MTKFIYDKYNVSTTNCEQHIWWLWLILCQLLGKHRGDLVVALPSQSKKDPGLNPGQVEGLEIGSLHVLPVSRYSDLLHIAKTCMFRLAGELRV